MSFGTQTVFVEEKLSLYQAEKQSCVMDSSLQNMGMFPAYPSSYPYITSFHMAFPRFDPSHLRVVMLSLPPVSPGLFPPSEELSCSSLLPAPSEL